MTDVGPLPRVAHGQLATLVTSPIALWGAFVVVHFWLGLLGLAGPGLPLGDVSLVYKFWVQHGFEAHQWVGLDTPWVYPIVALLPMIAAYAFGPGVYDSTWLSLVMIVDAAGFAVIMAFGRDRRAAPVAWWWLALLLFLGPVALGRIDSITAPIAIVGMLCLATAPRLAGVLLAVATWIKVWPAALVAAVLIAIRERARFATGVAAASGVIVVGAFLLGGGEYLLSFVSQQTGRGLQIESGIGTFWMWDSLFHPEHTSIYYDGTILTYQLRGPGVEIAAAIATPLIGIAVAALLVIAVLATRRGVPAAELLPPLALAITTALIVFNKVGSPQFVTWLAVPIVLGLATRATGHGMSFRVPAIIALAIAGLTQIMYPNFYQEVLQSNPVLLLVLSARNLLYVVLLVWAVVALAGRLRTEVVVELVDESDWLPRLWPFGAVARRTSSPAATAPEPVEGRDPG
jgi:hypothetical protein